MGFREYIQQLKATQQLTTITKQVSPNLEIAGILKAIEPRPTLFTSVEGYSQHVVGNLFATKELIANYFNIQTKQLIPFLTHAMNNPSPPVLVDDAPSQEETISPVDIDRLPILLHGSSDGGRYITSGVAIINDDEWGQNMSFHRTMQISKTKFAIRIVKGRHFHKYLEKNGELDVALCIGNSPNILVAGALSVPITIDELEIANTMEQVNTTYAKTSNLRVPADSEYIIEGKVYLDELHSEGPFVDLTETLDIVRQQPIFEVKTITHRSSPIWHALLPGGLEHKVLMGMPREPTIFQKVKDAGIDCVDVNINPGGCSWLHAVIQINKKQEHDGKTTIQAAFEGHKSLKHCFVVDNDINIYDPLEVEWAMATRFQGDKDMIIKPKEPGSSLDPSAEKETKNTTKIGFDLTMPIDPKQRADFIKYSYLNVDLEKYLKKSDDYATHK